MFHFTSGIGNELHQYYLDSKKQTIHRTVNLNFRCKIYGIACFHDESSSLLSTNSQFIVVYGGREMAIFILNIDKQLKFIKHLTLNDWISSVCVYESISHDMISFCVVSAHSVASEFNVNIDGKWRIEHKSSCQDKCTLYCSFIMGKNWMDTTIFGGTAFGELIVWKTNETGQQLSTVLHRVSGHNVI